VTSIAQALQQACEQLRASDSPRLDAEVLLTHVLGVPRSHLHAWPEKPLDESRINRFEALVAQRASGRPVAYLTGRREFWSLELEVSPHTLIPRPDTEQLVDYTLSQLPPDAELRLLDAGTGSGAIALALAQERPRWRVFASDRSPACLATARRNAARLDLARVGFLVGHWCDAIADHSLDALVSNPPYIAETDPHLQRGDVRFEPRSALAAGPDGLDELRSLAASAPRVLAPGGLIVLEHGFEQAAKVCKLLEDNGFISIGSARDLAGRERISFARNPG